MNPPDGHETLRAYLDRMMDTMANDIVDASTRRAAAKLRDLLTGGWSWHLDGLPVPAAGEPFKATLISRSTRDPRFFVLVRISPTGTTQEARFEIPDGPTGFNARLGTAGDQALLELCRIVAESNFDSYGAKGAAA